MSSGPATIDEILSASAERSPSAPAVEGKEDAWSYDALHEAAGRVATTLVEAGIRPGDRVAVCLRKSPRAIAALFGILRAGGIFVPLDRAAPVQRLISMATDCKPKALFGSGRKLTELLSSLPGDLGPALSIEVSDEGAGDPSRAATSGGRLLNWDDAMAAPPISRSVSRNSADLAYILYTSGSTGLPKGVMITHENALAFTSWARRRFEVRHGDRVASVAPFHFDLSTFDLYSTLEGGATTVLVPEEVALFPTSLAGYLESRRVTIAYLVPSVIAGMLLHGNLGGRRLDSLRLILFAGEVLQPRFLTQLMEAYPGVALSNLYGPTETNVCTSYEVQPEDRFRQHPVPIGIPASGDTVFALDESGDLIQEPGQVGELYAAGPTVAAGYWGDEAKTRSLFLEEHPHAPPGTRVYRTGDRVSLDSSGMWVYHGRGDHMVKSRGYRIELGDIESALHAHSGIEDAVAVAVPDDEVGHRIKACIVLKQGCDANAAAIQRHCAERLARYMVPEFVEFLPALPRTSTGKIDRAALAKGLPRPAEN